MASLIRKKHLIRACLQFQRYSTLSSWQEAWQCAGRRGAGEGAENFTFRTVEAGREGDPGTVLGF